MKTTFPHQLLAEGSGCKNGPGTPVLGTISLTSWEALQEDLDSLSVGTKRCIWSSSIQCVTFSLCSVWFCRNKWLTWRHSRGTFKLLKRRQDDFALKWKHMKGAFYCWIKCLFIRTWLTNTALGTAWTLCCRARGLRLSRWSLIWEWARWLLNNCLFTAFLSKSKFITAICCVCGYRNIFFNFYQQRVW